MIPDYYLHINFEYVYKNKINIKYKIVQNIYLICI